MGRQWRGDDFCLVGQAPPLASFSLPLSLRYPLLSPPLEVSLSNPARESGGALHFSASEMTYIVSGGALNSTNSTRKLHQRPSRNRKWCILASNMPSGGRLRCRLLRNIGREKYIVCRTNPTVGIGQGSGPLNARRQSDTCADCTTAKWLRTELGICRTQRFNHTERH